jgi:hypothetical protein
MMTTKASVVSDNAKQGNSKTDKSSLITKDSLDSKFTRQASPSPSISRLIDYDQFDSDKQGSLKKERKSSFNSGNEGISQ